MYYLKRASSMQRDDAVKIRSFLTQTLADFCYYDKYVTSLCKIYVVVRTHTHNNTFT